MMGSEEKGRAQQLLMLAWILLALYGLYELGVWLFWKLAAWG